jgi:hypothetical protein
LAGRPTPYEASTQAAEKLGIKLQSEGIANIGELDSALAAIKQSSSTVFIVQPSPFTYRERRQIIGSAMKNGLGTIFAFPVAAREGSLIAYGPVSYLQRLMMKICKCHELAHPQFRGLRLQPITGGCIYIRRFA